MELSRSTIVLFVFLMVMALGAIVVAHQFRTKLTTPAGLRILSEQRLRHLHTALLAYQEAHGTWPDSRLTLLRDRRLSIAAAAGQGYRQPEAGASSDTVVLWREQILPGARAGEPWAGPDHPASDHIPAIGHALTAGGELLEIPAAEFPARLATWTESTPAASGTP